MGGKVNNFNFRNLYKILHKQENLKYVSYLGQNEHPTIDECLDIKKRITVGGLKHSGRNREG